MTQPRKWLAECHAWLDDPMSVQFQSADRVWRTASTGLCPVDHPDLNWRIKPATITINGTELPKPSQTDTLDRLYIRFSTKTKEDYFWWDTREDRDAVYSKLVEVLGS